MFPDELKSSVEQLLKGKSGSLVQIVETRSIGGGCINEAYSLKTTVGNYPDFRTGTPGLKFK